MPMETSKKIILVSYIMMISITLFAMVSFFLGYDVNGLNILLGLTWGEVTAANSFYFWKARAENKIKLSKSVDPEILKKLQELNHLFD
jgi:hypothetical protein